MAGQFDPITSSEWGKLAAETLSNSYFFEFPNLGHGVMDSDRCALEIGLQILDDPTIGPDASCLDELVEQETITRAQADLFIEVHDRQVEAGLME